jgi:hypothetical protein
LRIASPARAFLENMGPSRTGKRMARNGITGALARTMDFAQRYRAAVDFADVDRARIFLARTHVLADPNEAEAAGFRLTMPTQDIFCRED